MADLNLLNRPLPGSENPGLETLDPRFQEMALLAQNESFPELAAKTEALFGENVFDIRLIGYYLHAVLLEQGLVTVTRVLQCFSRLLKENWGAIGPVEKKEKHTQASLNWLLSRLLKTIQYHEKKQDEVWAKLVETFSSQDVQSLLEGVEELRRAVNGLMEAPAVNDILTNLGSWVKEFQKIIQGKEAERQKQEQPPPQEVKASQPATSQPERPQQGGEYGTLVGESYHMRLLMRKLAIFEMLVQKQQIPKAALVAYDISQIVNSFDPRLYLPKLFAQYFKLLSQNIEQITGYWQNKDSLAWSVMDQLYKVDPDAFVEM